MTENLIHKLEEKMMAILSEVEHLRKEVQRLNHENVSLKIEKETSSRKLQDLVSLLDAVNSTVEEQVVSMTTATINPILA
ncbi:MAG: hypothetical protein A3F12_06770 [Gammaproteobacteria bacterium RIFCSPHIGHO2_12_FULL_38_14]|nr:MAG: hypothetical protein A3F12_06770 [Gammaproteobacteria bacterium RIFCSPHIGHO2_12_FULL_38_14]